MKKKITEQIVVVTQKYEQFQKLYEILHSEFVSAIELAEEKNDMTLATKGNALKRKNDEAFEDANKIQEVIVLLKEKSRKIYLYLLFGKN